MDPTLLALRWAHVLAACVAVGGLVFARFGLLPALQQLDETTRDGIHDRIRRSWMPWVMGAITLLLASGLANFLLFNARVREEDWGGGEWMRQTGYHALFGIKFLLAMLVFFFASGLAGRGRGTQWIRNDRATWLTVTIGLAVAVVMISSWMRQLHVGPNPTFSSGVSAERPAASEQDQRSTRETGEGSNGQEGQEADRGAPAEDREAPAAAGGSQEAAR
ncbi:MAG: hypothetical protein ACKO40_07570 [Planctomycetaceae bacterium]